MLKKSFGEYFDSKEPMKDMEQMIEKAEEMTENLEKQFLAEMCASDDVLPLFEYDINMNNEGE